MMRIKIVEIFKFIVSVAIGFTLRIMFENSQKTPILEKNITPNEGFSDLNLDNIHEQLRQPYVPKTFRDVIEFRYFNFSMVFDTHLGQIETKMKPYHSSDIKDIMKQVEPHINHGQSDKYTILSLINGFERIDPIRGKEYILDLELVLDKHRNFNAAKRIYRINLIKPFTYAHIVSQNDVTPIKDNVINILYTCSDQQVPFLEFLLHNHENHIINIFPVNVTIYLCSKEISNEKVLSMINNFIKKHESIKSYKMHLIHNGKCTFKAPAAINQVVKLLGNTDSKLVILPVNVNVTNQFLQRCFSIMSDHVVYVPIPFAEFLNRDASYANHLNEESGIWDHENHEILCINQNTFNKAGGLFEKEANDKAHLLLINKLIKLNIVIFRSTDPSVRLSYHQINCKSQAELFYSNLEYCEKRQKRTFQSLSKHLNSVQLT